VKIQIKTNRASLKQKKETQIQRYVTFNKRSFFIFIIFDLNLADTVEENN